MTSTVFERGSLVPSAKMLTFYRAEPFTIKAEYTPDSDIPSTADRSIGGRRSQGRHGHDCLVWGAEAGNAPANSGVSKASVEQPAATAAHAVLQAASPSGHLPWRPAPTRPSSRSRSCSTSMAWWWWRMRR